MTRIARCIALFISAFVVISASAKIEKTTATDKFTVTVTAANGEVVRTEVTTPVDEKNLQTVITAGDGKEIGRVDRLVTTITEKENSKIYATRNTHYDDAGTYQFTSYSLIIFDAEGKIIDIIETSRDEKKLDFGFDMDSTGIPVDFGGVTEGAR
tara:strand:- start:82 stop:546 length:465 start_codon:yes stop_codon:yes gene_type:complete